MQNITDEEKALYMGSADKNLLIEFENGTKITTPELYLESFSLVQNLLDSDDFGFGKIANSTLKVKTSSIALKCKGMRFTASFIVGAYKRKLGTFTVVTDELTDNKKYREISACDDATRILNADVTEWYENLSFPMTLRAFRTSFFVYLGIPQVDISLVNDGMSVEKTIQADVISGKMIIEAICEINGCFGGMNSEGEFRYIDLAKASNALYPSQELYPNTNLYPESDYASKIEMGNYYLGKFKYADYKVKSAKKLQIRMKENDIGVIVGEEGNQYVIQNNFLVYGKGTEELTTIANNILSVLISVNFTPSSVETKGQLWLELGDYIKVYGNNAIVSFPILYRELKGIKALKDLYQAKGKEEFEQKTTGITAQIIQLRGKSNVLERSIEETRSTIEDVEQGLRGEIVQTATSLRSEYTKEIGDIQSQIDNKVNNYSGDYVPTLNNKPASDWTTTEERDKNIGVIFYKITSGIVTNAYRFQFYQGSYQWLPIEDMQGAEALALAQSTKTDLDSLTNRLNENYSTTTQMQSAISQSAVNITFSVSKTYTTKTESERLAQETIDKASKNTSQMLEDYSTTSKMMSAIVLATNTLSANVAATYQKISDARSDKEELESQISLTTELIQSKVSAEYVSQVLNDYSTTKQMQTLITQTQESIELSVSSTYETKTDAKTTRESLESSIKVLSDSIELKANKVDIVGLVSYASLMTSGRTIINGGNITTGNITVKDSSGNILFKADASNQSNTINIAGFNVDFDSLYSGGFGVDNSVFMCRSSGTHTICGVTTDGWVFGAGKNYGVRKDGHLYCTNATISGTVNSTSGVFTSCDIKGSTRLYGDLVLQDGAKFYNTSKSASMTFVPAGVTIQGTGSYSVGLTLNSSNGRVSITGSLYTDSIETSYGKGINIGINGTLGLQKSGYGRSYLHGNISSATRNINLPFSDGTLAIASSDSRIKKNIKPTKVNALDFLSKIQLHEFDYKDGRSNSHWNCGMVAQELMELDKNVIIEGSGGTNEDGSINPLCIDDFYLTGYLIKAIQELKLEIETLQSEV